MSDGTPYYDAGLFRLYVYNGSFHKDTKESWFGKLTLKIGDKWIFAGDSSGESKLEALKALMMIHKSFVRAMLPYEVLYYPANIDQDPIDRFLQDVENGKRKGKKQEG